MRIISMTLVVTTLFRLNAIALLLTTTTAFTSSSFPARHHHHGGSSCLSSTTAADADDAETVSIPESISAVILKKDLLRLIPKRPFGGPATNVTTSDDICNQIRATVQHLEYLTPLPPLGRSQQAQAALDGDWQLIYSDASEITRIAKLPLGFCLGRVFQPIDVAAGRLENQAMIKHSLLLASGSTRVLAKFEIAPLWQVNRVGIVNKGDRANVRFEKVIFSLRRFLILPLLGLLKKTAIPNGPSEEAGVVPSIDVTYLDSNMRISRGGDGSLFVLTRPVKKKKPMPMISIDQASKINVKANAKTYDASVDILPSGSRD